MSQGATPSQTPAAPASPAAATIAVIAVLGFLAFTAPATLASPNSALRHYKKADYPAAQAEFERLAKEKPADPRLRFNAGAAAFRAGDLKSASQHFQDALASTDLKLQSDSFYNLGNTLFQMGEQAGEPTERQKSWENSLRSFEAAVKLTPQHTNAQHNLDYVRQRLEQLKEQQKQQQKQQSSQGDNKDESKEKDPSQSQEKDSKKEEKKESQPEDGQQGDQKPQPNTDSESPQDKPESENQSPEKQDGQDSQSPEDNSPESQKSGNEQGADNASAQASDEAPAGEMSPQQALRLLDSAKGEEKLMPLEKKRARARTVKDW